MHVSLRKLVDGRETEVINRQRTQFREGLLMANNSTQTLTQQYGNLVPTGRLRDGKPRNILFDATKCIGCRHCVQACKDWNDHPRTTLYELSSTNWITMEPPMLEGFSPLWARNSCMHCDFPACAAVCPVEAITKYEEGPVVINQEICIGCEYCIHACPWEVITKNDITSKARKQAAAMGGYLYGDKEAGGGGVVYVLKEKKEAYGVRDVGDQKFPRHRI